MPSTSETHLRNHLKKRAPEERMEPTLIPRTHSLNTGNSATDQVFITLEARNSPKAGEALVFGLQNMDIYNPRRLDSYVRYYFSNDNRTEGRVTEISQATVCYRYWILQYRDIIPLFSYSYSDWADNAIYFFQKITALDFYYNDGKEHSNLVLDDTPEMWHHHCFVFTHPTYKIYIDGEMVREGHLSVESAIIPLNGTIYLGHDQDTYDGGRDPQQTLTGYMTQVNFWDYPINPDEIKRMAECVINLRGNIISSDTTPFETSFVQVETMKIREFCQKSGKVVIIPDQMYPDIANRFCFLTDSLFYVPENDRENEELSVQAQKFADICEGHSYRLLYLGASDREKEGLWAKFTNGAPLVYFNWFEGEPNGQRDDNCIVLRRYDPYWADMVCDYKLCFSCKRTHMDYLQLRGLCEAKEHQTRFLLERYINWKPYFRGYYNLLIYHSGYNEWRLNDTHTNITLASLSPSKSSDYPIGRNTWDVVSPFCNNVEGDSVVLGLSICTTEEFMCSDGSCVHRSVRCNLLDDCLDRSDEENCTLVSFSDRYQDYKPPPGESFGVPLKISPEVSLIRFSNIDDINLAFYIEIEVALVWMDRNLRFKNIKSEEGKNKLSDEEVGHIWKPEIEFLNVNNGQLQLLKSGIYARVVGSPDPPLFTDVKMDTIYQPENSRLVLRQQYYASFNCLFYLFSYPFDTQTCSIIVKLASADLKVIDMENATVEYGGLRHLSKYEVKDLRIFMRPRSGYAIMEVTFDLERRYSLLVLTVFLPTFLLLGIGYVTLFVKLKDFEVRTMMALTTLLVLYTMFDQVSSGLPDTAYIKMVDLWFFFCIFLIFSINLVHIATEFLPPGEEEEDYGARLFSKRRDLVSPVDMVKGVQKQLPSAYATKWTGARVLALCRKVVYPTIVVLFGLGFWVVILLDKNV